MDPTPRILLVDDAPEIQLLGRSALEKDFAVMSAATLAEARTLLSQGEVDLVILDVELPDGNGMEFCSHLKGPGNAYSLPVILLTSKDQLEDKLKGFSAGADDYMVKPFHAAELRARVQLRLKNRPGRAAGGVNRALLGPHSINGQKNGVIVAGPFKFDLDARAITVKTLDNETVPVRASGVLFKILLFMAQAEGRVVSREQIIREIGSGEVSDSQLSGRTVDTYICKLRKKLVLSPYTIQSVYGAGYKLVLI
jgi:DNA-binding response OmpR family regulator